MRDNDSAKELFTKGTTLFQQKDYKEAMNIFVESQKKSPNKGTVFYISSCLKKLNKGANNTNKTSSSEVSNDDIECEKILNTNNCYFLLQITKDSSPEIIKKSYKELAIKFHPDKNHSSKAEEAFKKIYNAYYTIINAENREKYDKYSECVDCKPKQSSDSNHYYNRYTKCYNKYHQYCDNSDTHQHFNHQTSSVKSNLQNNTTQCSVKQVSSFKQLLPIIIVCGLYLFVKLFKRIEINNLIPLSGESLYQFNQSAKYYFKRRTSINDIEYYVGKAFLLKYSNVKELNESRIEFVIEREYLLKLKEQCREAKSNKTEIEYKMILNKKNSTYKIELSHQLKAKKYESCKEYEAYSQIIQ